METAATAVESTKPMPAIQFLTMLDKIKAQVDTGTYGAQGASERNSLEAAVKATSQSEEDQKARWQRLFAILNDNKTGFSGLILTAVNKLVNNPDRTRAQNNELEALRMLLDEIINADDSHGSNNLRIRQYLEEARTQILNGELLNAVQKLVRSSHRTPAENEKLTALKMLFREKFTAAE
jgi:hypothetical protein